MVDLVRSVPARPIPKRLRLGALIVASVAAGVVLLLAKNAFTGERTHTLRGKISAPECRGNYAIENAIIEVRDGANNLVGSAFTSPNEWGSRCNVEFQIRDVPRADVYRLRVGPRVGASYTYEQVSSHGWFLSMSLGR